MHQPEIEELRIKLAKSKYVKVPPTGLSDIKLLRKRARQNIEGNSLQEMIKENLIAERIAVESYREMIGYLKGKDSTTQRLLEDILTVEEEHADDLSSLLVGMED